MVTIIDYPYFQPQHPDGTMPEFLDSNVAFQSEQTAIDWLEEHASHEKPDFEIREYCNDDLADVVLIDANGDTILKIEDLTDEAIEDLIVEEVKKNNHGLKVHTNKGESKDAYNDRLYGEAQNLVMEAISEIEEANDYDFSSYGGNPDTEWYDEARHNAIITVMKWLSRK